MSVRELLAELRGGRVPGPEAVAAFAAGLADGRVSDAQAGAFAMAVCTGPGLGEAGRVALTRAMAASGDRLDWGAGTPVLDKHSTGGVGDPVSLVLAPAMAALGARVPMISGRGLGHTGGTLDKLDAIPGVATDLPEDRFRAVVAEAGCAIVAATGDIAPADRRLYAIRDVTATVDQVDLITASILSKKLAAGLSALVLDVKAGRGAFMADAQAARRLARALVDTATGAGCPAAALVTAMDEPLAPACGNALEVAEAVAVLRGEARDTRLREVAVALGGELLALGGLVTDAEAGRRHVADVLDGGDAAERFAAMVAAQGGPADIVEAAPRHLPVAPVIRDVAVAAGGTLGAIDGTALGHAVVALGGGRRREGDRIDPAVGLDRIARSGARLAPGDPLCRVHAASEDAADAAEERVRAAMPLDAAADAAMPPSAAADATPLVLERVA